MENNYSVYQHVTPDGMYYFGQTNNIKRRWSNNGAGYKTTSLYPYIEKFGWDNIQHIVLFENQTKENALWIEDFLIETAREDGVCINQQRSGLVSKEEGYQREYQREYREQNKEQIKEQHKQYYERNKEKFKEYQEQNKDKIREYQEQNKDKINEQKRNYYERNKEKFKEYREQNKEQIREYQREYQREYKEQNKDKIREYNREYQRQYRQRKKLEKQLKEVVETTLF